MNVLIFVMTMLMLLALMTYARLDSYRNSQTLQIIFKYYMENDERGYINLQAEPTYDSIKVATKSEKDKNNEPKADGSPRIGIQLLIDKTKRDAQPKEWLQTQILLKNLIVSLYKDQPFFKSAMVERPSLPDDLIADIIRAADALPEDQKLQSAKELANLRLDDPKLDQIFYKILHGIPYKKIEPKKNEDLNSEAESTVETDQTDMAPKKGESDFESTKGYYSLLDYITTDSPPKIRIYLAPRNVLNAIFHDPNVVDAIIKQRKQLYRQALKDEDNKELSETFKTHFDNLKDSAIDTNSLSYKVSKTNPKDYE